MRLLRCKLSYSVTKVLRFFAILKSNISQWCLTPLLGFFYDFNPLIRPAGHLLPEGEGDPKLI